jgi:hypothetical protein
MAAYVVMEPPAARAEDAAEQAVLVRDGFALLAFLLPPLWLLWHRLWIEAAMAFAVGVALTALGETAGFGFTGAALSLLVSIFVGLEGQAMRFNAMRRRGWREWGVVEAGDVAEAEIRYLAGEAPEAEVRETPRPATPAMHARPVSSAPALGLLGYTGRN